MTFPRIASVLFLLSIGAGFAKGQVTIAERPLVGPFTTIQQGIDAALEGESLLVIPGHYASFTIDAKSVQVFVRGTGEAIITGEVSVKNLAPAQFVVLSRLKVTGQYVSPNSEPALDITGITGHVRVQDSTFNGHGALSFGPTLVTGMAVRLTSSLNVVFSTCTIAAGFSQVSAGDPPIDGGTALDSVNSSIAMYDCSIIGGRGSEETNPRGGNGGTAYHGLSYGLFAAGCIFKGGLGGGGDYIGCNAGGIGADALVIDAGQAHLLDNTFFAGGGGWSSCGPYSPSGQTIVAQNGAVIDSISGTRRQISLTSVNMDTTSVPITITGQPGDSVFLIIARRPSFLFKKPLHGTWMVPSPFLTTAIPMGTIGAGGTLVLNHTFDIPNGTMAAKLYWLQAICIDTNGQTTLTGPAHVLSLE